MVASALASSPANAVKRLYLANDDHTDYFWTTDDVGYRTVFLNMLDFYMAQAEATAANPVDAIPSDLILLGRVVGLLRGVCATLGSPLTPMEMLLPFAQRALAPSASEASV